MLSNIIYTHLDFNWGLSLTFILSWSIIKKGVNGMYHIAVNFDGGTYWNLIISMLGLLGACAIVTIKQGLLKLVS